VIKIDISSWQVFVSLETEDDSTAVPDLITGLTTDRHASNPIGQCEACLLAVPPGIAKL
jgi:hypothetical protein